MTELSREVARLLGRPGPTVEGASVDADMSISQKDQLAADLAEAAQVIVASVQALVDLATERDDPILRAHLARIGAGLNRYLELLDSKT